MPNAIFFYRLSRWFYLKKVPIIPKLLQLLIFLLYNSKVPPSAKIGKGSFFVCKGVGVVIIDNAIIGNNCKIGISVKIVGKGPYKNVAKIGDNVWIGPGAVIVGAVEIQNDVIIAPNSVVTKSIPTGKIVGGIPAKIIGNVSELNYKIGNNESFINGYVEFMR